MQPKWLCLQICSTFHEKNIEKHHFSSTSLSWKSTLRAYHFLRFTFVTLWCFWLLAVLDFLLQTLICLVVGAIFLGGLANVSRSFTCFTTFDNFGETTCPFLLRWWSVWQAMLYDPMKIAQKSLAFWQIWITLTSIHSVCCVSSRAFLSQAVEFSRDFCLEIFKLNFCDQLDQLDQLIPAFCCRQIISHHTTILWIFAWYRCLVA